MDKILIAITTYNQSEYTKLFYKSFSKLDSKLYDLIVIDDASTDDTVEWCKENNIHILTRTEGKGLSYSWNLAYKYFKEHGYKYFAIANNDILIPAGALEEMKNVLDKWPGSLVAQLSTEEGVGHNRIQSIERIYGEDDERNKPGSYQKVQNSLLAYKDELISNNNLYLADPFRMKMFNGFFFMMNEMICQYEREDGNLFDPQYVNVKNEDEFNWGNLIQNDDFAMLCKTAFVFHYKGVSFTKAGIEYSNDLEKHLKTRENNK